MTAPNGTEHRELGSQGLVVSAIGLGCMGMTGTYGPADESEAIATIHRAIDRGVTFFDTAEVYGPHTNELLVGKALRGRREQLALATKFGVVRHEDGTRRFDGSPENVRRSCDGSLRRLGVDHIDLYYLHRIDPQTPIEETVGAMAQLVDDGKVRYIGLSGPATGGTGLPVTADALRRACAVHPITALQSEYSLLAREPEDETLLTCRELGIGFVAFSPLAGGLLTGAVRRFEELDDQDIRRGSDDFQPAGLERNRILVEGIRRLAATKHATPAQLALRWLLAQGTDIVPIPGTKHRDKLDQLVDALEIPLILDDLVELERVAGNGGGVRED